MFGVRGIAATELIHAGLCVFK